MKYESSLRRGTFMMYALLEFDENSEKLIEAVPESWIISDSECYWPKGNSNFVQRMLKKNASPKEPFFRRIQYSSSLGKFSSYSEARDLAKYYSEHENQKSDEDSQLEDQRLLNKELLDKTHQSQKQRTHLENSNSPSDDGAQVLPESQLLENYPLENVVFQFDKDGESPKGNPSNTMESQFDTDTIMKPTANSSNTIGNALICDT